MSHELEQAFETLENFVQEAAQNLFVDWVIKFLWILFLGYLLYAWWLPESPDERITFDIGLFEPGRCTENFSIIIWHLDRKDLLDIQHAKWKFAVSDVIIHEGSLSTAYIKWSSQKTNKPAVFLQATNFCTSQILDKLVYRVRVDPSISFVDETFSCALPFAVHPTFGHSIQADYITKRLHTNPACASGHSDTFVMEHAWKDIFGIPFRVMPDSPQNISLVNLSDDRLEKQLGCLKVLYEKDK